MKASRKWEDDIKNDLNTASQEDVDQIQLVQDSNQRWALVNMSVIPRKIMLTS